MGTTSEEIAARIRALLELRDMGQKDLAKRINLDPSALSRALSGDRNFKVREIALIAEVLDVSTAAILEGPTAEPAAPLAMAARRSFDHRPSVEAAIDRVAFYGELARVVDSAHRLRALDVVLRDEAPWKQGESVAEQVLVQTGLSERVLPGSMFEFAELLEQNLGIQVALEPLGPGMDGLAASCERFDLALVSTANAPARQRWTLAHEVAHLVLDDAEDLLVDESVWSSRTPVESRANAFAAGFLMPASSVKREWRRGEFSEEHVAYLLDTFHVSLDALAFRLHNLGLVNASRRDSIRGMYPYVSLLRNQAGRQTEGMWLPTRLTADAANAYGRGKLGVRWLADLVQLHPDDLLSRLNPSEEEVVMLEEGSQSQAV